MTAHTAQHLSYSVVFTIA